MTRREERLFRKWEGRLRRTHKLRGQNGYDFRPIDAEDRRGHVHIIRGQEQSVDAVAILGSSRVCRVTDLRISLPPADEETAEE